MTEEEIEELDKLYEEYKEYVDGDLEYHPRDDRYFFLQGKKEEHDKVLEVIELLKGHQESIDYNGHGKINGYTEEINEILEKLQS